MTPAVGSVVRVTLAASIDRFRVRKRLASFGRYSVLCLIICCTGCRAYWRAKQVRTVANMQTMCGLIDRYLIEHPTASAEEITKIVRDVSDGKDAWGNAIVVGTELPSTRTRYVLVSPGTDARLDVDDVHTYLKAPPRSARESAERDIVFIDGREVTQAGK